MGSTHMQGFNWAPQNYTPTLKNGINLQCRVSKRPVWLKDTLPSNCYAVCGRTNTCRYTQLDCKLSQQNLDNPSPRLRGRLALFQTSRLSSELRGFLPGCMQSSSWKMQFRNSHIILNTVLVPVLFLLLPPKELGPWSQFCGKELKPRFPYCSVWTRC
jgi:hypothetical protein